MLIEQQIAWTPEELCAAKQAYDRVIRVRAFLTQLSSDDRRRIAKSILDMFAEDECLDVNTLVRRTNAKLNALQAATPRGGKKQPALADKADREPAPEGEGRAV